MLLIVKCALCDVSSRLDSRHVSLAGISQKWWCVLPNELNYPITDVHFDCFSKVVSAKLLNWSYFFPFRINTYFVERYFETRYKSGSSQNLKFISAWTHGSLFYSMSYNPLISLFILFKLSQIWSEGAQSSWLLWPNKSLSFFEYVLTFQDSMMFQAHLVLSLPWP